MSHILPYKWAFRLSVCHSEANLRQKIFDARFLHDRVPGEKSLFYEQVGEFCRATIFIKDTFFSDHSKVEKKPREASEAIEADLQAKGIHD